MVRARTAQVLAVLLAAALAPSAAAKPQTLVKLKLPAAGNASLASIPLKSKSKAKKPPLPKPRIVHKKRIPKGVAVIFAVRRLKQRGRFQEIVVVLRKKSAGRAVEHAAQAFDFSGNRFVGIGNPGVIEAGRTTTWDNVLGRAPLSGCNTLVGF